VFSREELQAIAEIAVKNDLYIISDEIYEYLVYENQSPHISIASLGKEVYDRTIIVNGYSKSYSMTGWRVGYTASNKEIAGIIGNIQSHQTSNINTLTQKAALAAEQGGRKCVEDMCVQFKKRRDLMFDKVNEISGFDALKPEGAFYIFVDISGLLGKSIDGQTINSGADFADLLLDKQKVAIVPCADFGYENHVRLSYATSEKDIDEGMERIKNFVNEIK
jgi:aspartate aminotransferase